MADDYGNSTTTAGTIAIGSEVIGNAEDRYDEDWFGMQLQAGTTYWLEALGERSSGGTADLPRLNLYDGDGVYIRGIATGGANGDPLMAFTPLVSGIHYVGVGAALDGGTYTLRVAIATIADDFRDDSATTATLAIGSQLAGVLEVPTDADWFRAELVAGDTYEFELRGVDGGGGTLGGGSMDLLLRASDSTGTTAGSASAGGAGGDPLLSYTALESGVHYVQVSSQLQQGTTTGTYTLSASQVPTPVHFIAGTDGDDLLHDTALDDLVAASSGLDVVTYSGALADHTLSFGRFSHVITITGSGSDELHDVERVHFDDYGRAFDIDGNAGKVAKIIGAVFGSASVQNRAYVAKGLALADSGMSHEELAQYALDRALGPDADSVAIVNLLYGNVMHMPPPQQALDFYTGLLDDGVVTPGWLGMYAADTVYNLVATLGIRPAEYPLYFEIG